MVSAARLFTAVGPGRIEGRARPRDRRVAGDRGARGRFRRRSPIRLLWASAGGPRWSSQSLVGRLTAASRVGSRDDPQQCNNEVRGTCVRLSRHGKPPMCERDNLILLSPLQKSTSVEVCTWHPCPRPLLAGRWRCARGALPKLVRALPRVPRSRLLNCDDSSTSTFGSWMPTCRSFTS